MEKYVSDSDEAGYIYAYEIRDPKPPNEFHIKIGRLGDPIRRLDEWDRQCGSKETAVRGWWPGVIQDGNTANSSGLLSRMIDPGEKGKYCHRLERLIHLELRDIALNSTHLTPRFQEIVLGRGGSSGKGHPPSESPSSLKRANQSKRRKAPAQADSPLKPCPDCKKIHRKIFVLERAMSGELKGREWELVVKPIIEKWGNFVTAHASKKV
ncbi:unnamed protein product [Rhizoctonia solani]|uniref:Bacteriophage T5 Orf172 DNA-binding domain-containing protein n=1 Tax=Rhizoctonia solani TaxID=456999 RepID=A0A8H3CUU6_9AGAM|nr:unnamed protein product [Rhizoctonia solani]